MHRSYRVAQKMLLLSESQVRQCLSMSDCLRVNRLALTALATGQAQVPTRLGLSYRDPRTTTSPPSSSPDGPSAPLAEDWTLVKPATYNPFANINAVEQEEPSDHHDHSHSHNHHHDHNAVADPPSSLAHDDNNNSNIDDDYDEILMGMKVVSIRANNPTRYQLPLVPATILTLNAATGQVDAVVASTYLTAARTAAGSAVATALVRTAHAAFQYKQQRTNETVDPPFMILEPLPIQHLVVFGAGLQAELHIEAIATALQQPTIPKISILNRSEARAQALYEKLVKDGRVAHAEDCSVVLLHDSLAVMEALSTADVIVTATNTITPILDGTSVLKSGCHINGVGSYTPDMQEVSAKTVAHRCKVLMDTAEARAVGDLAGLSQQHPCQLLGQVLQYDKENRNEAYYSKSAWELSHWLQDPSSSFLDCTFYKAVGTAIQDVMTADLVVKRARELGIGTQVDMDS